MIPYKHEPFTDFSIEENRTKLQEGLKTVKSYLGKDYPLIIGGERIMTDEKKESYNPAEKTETIGHMSQAGQEHAQQAMDVALETFESWRKSTFEFRSDDVFKAAAIIRKCKFEFTFLLLKEAGKPLKAAEADTAKTIDVLEYYGRNNLKIKDG